MESVFVRGLCMAGTYTIMRKLLLILLFVVPQMLMGQSQYEHRGTEFATHGTDFWVCFPRALYSSPRPTHYCLYIMAEHDCEVTISNDLLDYHYVHQVRNCHAITWRLDTLNLICFDETMVRFRDTIDPSLPMSAQPVASPQSKAFHITSTDTICVYLYCSGFNLMAGEVDVTNVFPTDLLRDEYVVQTHWDDNTFVGRNRGMFQILATEDSTIVDIELSDMDWLGRPKDSIITVTLDRGLLYNVQVAPTNLKYSPLQYQAVTCTIPSFLEDTIFQIDTNITDLSGTRIKARDHKRIAVFQGNQSLKTCTTRALTSNNHTSQDLGYEQALPIRFAGKEFLIPNISSSFYDWLQFTALVDGTEITITDPIHGPIYSRTLNLDARKSTWFVQDSAWGPFYIISNHPILVSLYSNVCNWVTRGDPAMLVVKPVEWWHGGPANGSQVFWVDPDRNGYPYYHSTHVFTRTADVPYLYFDRTRIDELFCQLPGTPYSYAYIDYNSEFNDRRAHRIESQINAPFWVVADAEDYRQHMLFSYSHYQVGKSFLEVNGIPADSVKYDSIWCMYDPIQFHGWVERPADSIVWDFGDGNIERYIYEEGQNVSHTYSDTGRFTVVCTIKYRDEARDTQFGCVACESVFTLPPEVMYASVWVHNHYDSSFSVTLCEGDYQFRGREFSFTGEYEVTTYWTPSGCDTLWHINLTICPHCIEYSDTVREDRLPWNFNGISFGSEIRYYPIHIDIGEECDSVIYYSLYVIREEDIPPDGTFVLMPNVITPASNNETDRKFRLFCSEDIERAEVVVFDRMGRKLAEFDGLTGEWDGTYKGKPCPQGAYAYRVRFIGGSIHNWQVKSGTVTIIR